KPSQNPRQSLKSTSNRFIPARIFCFPFPSPLPPSGSRMSVQPIENHAIVGDLNTVALVALDATIDFLCFPRFDSPTIFASLLDAERGGSFRIAPALNNSKHKQIYLPDSNILLTRFLAADGVVEVSDFMPVAEDVPAHNLVRRVK